MNLQILANDKALPGWTARHGLSMLLDTGTEKIIIDTSQDKSILDNVRQAGIDLRSITHMILSHGHYDHTGGMDYLLPRMPQVHVYYVSPIDRVRYRLCPPDPPRDISMPEGSFMEMVHLTPNRLHVIFDFIQLTDQLYLTGPIPRFSSEKTSPNLTLDPEGTIPDEVDEEMSVLLRNGTLITGCCHAGIINTIKYCQLRVWKIPVRTIIGGLHLHDATEERLETTAEYLKTLSLDRVILLHCTGDYAIDFLRNHLSCPVIEAVAGESFEI